jgi:hypothetical protein
MVKLTVTSSGLFLYHHTHYQESFVATARVRSPIATALQGGYGKAHLSAVPLLVDNGEFAPRLSRLHVLGKTPGIHSFVEPVEINSMFTLHTMQNGGK